MEAATPVLASDADAGGGRTASRRWVIESNQLEDMMRISTLAIPQRTDALVTIAAHMSALPLGILTEARRAEIVRNLLYPMLSLIDVLRSVVDVGPDEEAVLMHFIGSVYVRSELAERDASFRRLLAKLQARRSPGIGEG